MVEIIVKQYGIQDKKITKMIVHMAGVDGEYMWIKMIAEDGEEICTGYFKEECRA